MENTLHPEIELQPLCTATWDLNKDKLRENIEDAVYSNPRLLDDFSARIILYDPRTLFIPTEVADEKAGAEEDLYRKVYASDEADIMTDRDDDLTAAWSLAPGVKSFLMRTFPGARITCNLMDKVKSFRKDNEGATVYAAAREGETDIILLDGRELISASTHEWAHPDDIAFLVLNLLDVYDVKLPNVKIRLEGTAYDTEAWQFIKDKVKEIEINEDNKR